MSHASLPVLSLLETRVLGVLAEKQKTVPDTYPLSLNALLAGCNQKTSRDPVIEATESEVLAALDVLRSLSLIVETSGGRVMRYGHNIERGLQIPGQSAALLATLMLRGPQTVAELRMNSDRLHRFADNSAVEGFLDELVEHPGGAMVMELPRQPGARENRWTHLLSGVPEPQPASPSTSGALGQAVDISLSELAAIKANVSRLEAKVVELQVLVERLYSELDLKAE